MSERNQGALGGEPYAPPGSTFATSGVGWGPSLRFVIRRAVRLVITPPLLAACASLILQLDQAWQVGLALLTGVLLWVPTTLVQSKALFYPDPPDHGLESVDGKPQAASDVRAVARSQVFEDAVGSLAPLALAAWFATVHPAAAAVALVLFGLFVFRNAQALSGLLLREALLDLWLLDDHRARKRLEWLYWLRLPRGDHAAFLLARARFRTGDKPGALASLDRIRDRRAWPVDAVRVQMTIGEVGPEAARAVAADLRNQPDMAGMALAIEALADIYAADPARLTARADEIDALAPSEGRRLAQVLLAAAHAPNAPEEARRWLAAAHTTPARARASLSPWPPAAARLRDL